MSYSSSQELCEHLLIFEPSLDGAAVCARCGATALIAPHQQSGHAVHIKWNPPLQAAGQAEPAGGPGAG